MMRISIFILLMIAFGCSSSGVSKAENDRQIGWIDSSVLTAKDIRQVEEVSGPPEKRQLPFLGHYWDCFQDVEKVKVECSPYDEDPEDRGDQLIEFTYSGNPRRSFIFPRASDFKTCMRYRKELARLSKGQKTICFTGDGGDWSSSGEFSARFIRYKTKRGCFSYFTDDCAK